MSYGPLERPVVGHSVGFPSSEEGVDGDIQIRQTNLGVKLFGKLNRKWHDVPLAVGGVSRFGKSLSDHLAIDDDSVDIYKNNVKIAEFGSDIKLTGGDITISDGTRDRLVIGANDIDMYDESGNNVVNIDSGVVTLGYHATTKIVLNGSAGTMAVGSKFNIANNGNVTINDLICDDITYSGIISYADATNVLIGHALEQGGSYNIGLGHACFGVGGDLGSSTQFNICMGANSLYTIEDGDYNICLGSSAGNGITDGSRNIVLGIGMMADSTSMVLTTGDNNILIGNLLRTNDYNTERSILLGDGIISPSSDSFRVGKASNYISASFSGIQTFDVTSDRRKKQNIKDSKLGLGFVNTLKPVTFQWKAAKDFPEEWEAWTYKDGKKVYDDMDTETVQYGLIAQDVKASMDKFNANDFTGWSVERNGIQQISREMFVVPLIKAVQELSAKIDTMQTEINNLKQ